MADDNIVTLIIKNPSNIVGDFQLRVGLNLTVRGLKDELHEKYPLRPCSDEQKIIFSGQVLQNSAKLNDIFRQHDVSQPQTFHLVLKSAANATPPPQIQRAATAPATTPQLSTPTNVASPAPLPAAATMPAPAHMHQDHPYMMPGYNPYLYQAMAMPMHFSSPMAMPSPTAMLEGVAQMTPPPGYQFAFQMVNGQPFMFAVPIGTMAAYPAANYVLAPPQGSTDTATTSFAAAVPPAPATREAPRVALRQPEVPDENEDADGPNEYNPKLLMKLALMVYIFGQDGGTERLVLLSLAAIVYYLWDTNRLPSWRRPPMVPAAPTSTESSDSSNPETENNAASGGTNAEAVERPPSLLRDVEHVFVAFFSSLLPAWDTVQQREPPVQRNVDAPIGAGPGGM